MSALPFLRISAPLNALLAAAGLVAVAALTTPDMSGRIRLVLAAVLAVIWGVYVLQLTETLIMPPDGRRSGQAAGNRHRCARGFGSPRRVSARRHARSEPLLCHLAAEAAAQFDLLPADGQGPDQRGAQPDRRHLGLRHRSVRCGARGLCHRARRPAEQVRQHSPGNVVGGGHAVDHRLWRRDSAKLRRPRPCRAWS